MSKMNSSVKISPSIYVYACVLVLEVKRYLTSFELLKLKTSDIMYEGWKLISKFDLKIVSNSISNEIFMTNSIYVGWFWSKFFYW